MDVASNQSSKSKFLATSEKDAYSSIEGISRKKCDGASSHALAISELQTVRMKMEVDKVVVS